MSPPMPNTYRDIAKIPSASVLQANTQVFIRKYIYYYICLAVSVTASYREARQPASIGV